MPRFSQRVSQQFSGRHSINCLLDSSIANRSFPISLQRQWNVSLRPAVLIMKDHFALKAISASLLDSLKTFQAVRKLKAKELTKTSSVPSADPSSAIGTSRLVSGPLGPDGACCTLQESAHQPANNSSKLKPGAISPENLRLAKAMLPKEVDCMYAWFLAFEIFPSTNCEDSKLPSKRSAWRVFFTKIFWASMEQLPNNKSPDTRTFRKRNNHYLWLCADLLNFNIQDIK